MNQKIKVITYDKGTIFISSITLRQLIEESHVFISSNNIAKQVTIGQTSFYDLRNL